MLADRRLGRFTIELDVLNDAPEVVKVIMSKTVILGAVFSLPMNHMIYDAQCDAFEEVPEGAEPPSYDVMFDSETSEVTWTKA